MEVQDFKLLGEDLGRVLVNFLPQPKYKNKINFLYRKFLNIIHEEALKWWLPFNQDRYLKRSYKEDNIEQNAMEAIEIKIPSLDEIEGSPIQPENDDISLNSHDENIDVEKQQIKSKEINPNFSHQTNSTEYSIIKESTENQIQLPVDEIEEYKEFENLIVCVEKFEHERAVQSSTDSEIDNSDSDDEDTNLVK